MGFPSRTSGGASACFISIKTAGGTAHGHKSLGDFRVAKSEVIERTGVGNDDHACGHDPLRAGLTGHVFSRSLVYRISHAAEGRIHLHSRSVPQKLAYLFHRQPTIPIRSGHCFFSNAGAWPAAGGVDDWSGITVTDNKGSRAALPKPPAQRVERLGFADGGSLLRLFLGEMSPTVRIPS